MRVAGDKRLIVFGYLFRVANRLQIKMDSLLTDLTAKQWFVLLSLGLFDSPPTLKQLAAMCDSSHQNIKQIVTKLSEKGFVTVTSDGKDGRAMRIAATEKIDMWDKEYEEEASKFVDEMFAGLSSFDISVLCTSILKVFENLDNMKGRGGDE